MRTRKQIEDEVKDSSFNRYDEAQLFMSGQLLEVLLDTRELLIKQKKVKKK